MSEKSFIQTKRSRKQYSAVKLLKYVRQAQFLNVKIGKFVGGNHGGVLDISLGGEVRHGPS